MAKFKSQRFKKNEKLNYVQALQINLNVNKLKEIYIIISQICPCQYELK